MRLAVLSPTRKALAPRLGETIRVVAVYEKSGSRKVGRKTYPTVLLRDLRNAQTGELLTDHLWFNKGRIWRAAELRPGDIVTFASRVIEYRTGYWGPEPIRQVLSPARRDFRLTPPTGLSLVWRASSGREEAA